MILKFSRLFVLLASVSISSAALADDPAPAFQPAAAAVVSGLSGLVSGTQQNLSNYRSNSRIVAIRGALARQLVNADPSKSINLEIANEAVLCGPRGTYAPIAVEAAYLGTVTATLNKFATPPKITTIGDAVGSLFQNYSIAASSGQVSPNSKQSILTICQFDAQNWPTKFYGADIVQDRSKQLETSLALDKVVDAIGTFSDLYQVLVSVITPLVAAPAAAQDSSKRNDAIAKFLTQYRPQLETAATDLAAYGSRLARDNRLQAVGQFAEKMATVRAISIDLSKVDACKGALAKESLSSEVRDKTTGVVVSHVPNDAYVVCYAQAWQQVSGAVQAAVTAASAYDSLADMSSDQLISSVETVKSNLSKVNPQGNQQGNQQGSQQGKVDLSQLQNAATQLVTYGQAVSQALSAANVAKIKADVDVLMKQF
jgi:hypothetical protein